jgi:hypothetical protein
MLHCASRLRNDRRSVWVATINAVGLALSSVLFLVGAAISNVWVPNAFAYAAAGLVAVAALGIIGLWITCWEMTPSSVYHTESLARAGVDARCDNTIDVWLLARLAVMAGGSGRLDLASHGRRGPSRLLQER